MIVCICRRVSDHDIARAVRDGCDSFDALQDALGVATCCGTCQDCAVSTFQQHASSAAGSAMQGQPGVHVMRTPPRRRQLQAVGA